MKLLFLYLLILSGSALATIYPEDGSSRLGYWYFGQGSGVDSQLLKSVAGEEDFALVEYPHNYRFLQDISLWSDDGRQFLMAKMPETPDVVGHRLTTGVFNDEDGFWRLNRITEEESSQISVVTRQMKWTLFEGGAAISGKFKDGETYIILEMSALERTKKYYHYLKSESIDDARAKELIAQDLEIKAKNIFFVDMYKHLDLVMMALPGGKILLHDPRLTLTAINESLAYIKDTKEEQKLLVLKDLINRTQDDTLIKFLDKIQDELKQHFEVIRVSGSMGPDINFFNAFLGKNTEGKTFTITNRAKGINALEKYWANTLIKHGIEREHIHFVGGFALDSFGIDCSGAPAGPLKTHGGEINI